MKKCIIMIIIVTIIISTISVSAYNIFEFFNDIIDGINSTLYELSEYDIIGVDQISEYLLNKDKWYWKYDSANKCYDLALKDKYGNIVSVRDIYEAIRGFADEDQLNLIKEYLWLKFFPDSNLVKNYYGKIMEKYSNEEANIIIGGEVKGGGGKASDGGVGRNSKYYTDKTSSTEYEGIQIINNMPVELIIEIMNNGIMDDSGNMVFGEDALSLLEQYIWVVDNYTAGDTVDKSVFNYQDNKYFDFTTLTEYDIEDYNIYYNDARNMYYISDDDEYYYIQYDITNISYTYFEPSVKRIVTENRYFELPDGRNSADLTAEEIKGLGLNYNIVNYERNLEDNLTKALFHFEGNANDASYFDNDIQWITNPSYTYYDMGTYLGGALFMQGGYNIEFKIPLEDEELSRNDDWTLNFKLYLEPETNNNANVFQIYINGYENVNNKWQIQSLWGSKACDSVALTKWVNGKFTVIATNNTSIPIYTGQWIDCAVEKYNGYLNIYVNGMLVKQLSFNESDIPNITIDDITIKKTAYAKYLYIDEIRFVSEPLYMGNDFVPSFVPYDTNLVYTLPDNVRNNSIAIKTDIEINKYRIGGVRPSLPDEGFLYIYVEDNRMKSAQVYNGAYWEEVQFRIRLWGKWVNPEDYRIGMAGDEFDNSEDNETVIPIDSDKVASDSGWSFGKLIGNLIEGILDVIVDLLKSLVSLFTNLIGKLFSSLLDFVSNALDGISGFTISGNQTASLISSMFTVIPTELQTFIIGAFSIIMLVVVIKLFVG